MVHHNNPRTCHASVEFSIIVVFSAICSPRQFRTIKRAAPSPAASAVAVNCYIKIEESTKNQKILKKIYINQRPVTTTVGLQNPGKRNARIGIPFSTVRFRTPPAASAGEHQYSGLCAIGHRRRRRRRKQQENRTETGQPKSVKVSFHLNGRIMPMHRVSLSQHIDFRSKPRHTTYNISQPGRSFIHSATELMEESQTEEKSQKGVKQISK